MTTPTLALLLAAAFALGALIGWLAAALRRGGETARLSAAEATAQVERERRVQAEAELAGMRREAAELGQHMAVAQEKTARAQELVRDQSEFLARARGELESSFKALAAAALQGSTEQFLALAEQRMQTSRTQVTADLEERRAAIEALLAPLRDTLARLDQKTTEIERDRIDAYSRLDENIRLLAETTTVLQEKTTTLSTALRSSQVRGRWGEIALRNVAELAGMTEHCDFEVQETQEEGGRIDMVVRLPGGRSIAVDSKAPIDAYLEACEAASDAVREDALDRHAKVLRRHVKSLASRNYASQLAGEVDLVVLFLPGDPFLAAAFAQDPDLQVDALRSKILLATPSTLVALLRTVAIYWQQERVAEDAQAILATAQDLYDRVAIFRNHLAEIGKGLERALGAFNDAVGSFQRNLLPFSSHLEDLKVTEQATRRVEELRLVERRPRELKDP
jgi:DNA recombination protein RmuC